MLFQIDEEIYALDLSKINEFIFSSQTEKNSETNISEVYAKVDEANNDNLKLVSKEIAENKTNGNASIDNIKYDMIKMMLDLILGIGGNGKNNGMFIDQPFHNEKTSSTDSMSVGEIIAFNTFVNEGFLININQK